MCTFRRTHVQYTHDRDENSNHPMSDMHHPISLVSLHKLRVEGRHVKAMVTMRRWRTLLRGTVEGQPNGAMCGIVAEPGHTTSPRPRLQNVGVGGAEHADGTLLKTAAPVD